MEVQNSAYCSSGNFRTVVKNVCIWENIFLNYMNRVNLFNLVIWTILFCYIRLPLFSSHAFSSARYFPISNVLPLTLWFEGISWKWAYMHERISFPEVTDYWQRGYFFTMAIPQQTNWGPNCSQLQSIYSSQAKQSRKTTES